MDTLASVAPIDLPQWFPGETFFSLLARFHALSGYAPPDRTCRMLFGHPRNGTQHDFPCRLDFFVRQTQSAVGALDAIVQQHTIAPFFFAFAEARLRADVVSAMRTEGLAGLKMRMGLIGSRIRAHHPLKACADCMKRDVEVHGVAYWHLEHQYPGVWVCLAHGAPLLYAQEKVSGALRFHYLLPHQCTLCAAFQRTEVERPPSTAHSRLLTIARLCADVAQFGIGNTLDASLVMQTYRVALSQHGLLRRSMHADSASIGAAYAHWLESFADIEEFAAMGSALRAAKNSAPRLLYAPRGGTHPLRHILMTAWLFESWTEFLAVYAQASHDDYEPQLRSPPEGKADPMVTVASETPGKVLQLLAEGRSARSVAQALNLDVVTVSYRAAQGGREIARRPKVLRGSLRDTVIARIACGDEAQAIADFSGISLSSVHRLLHSVPGLYALRRAAIHASAQQLARHAWRRALRANRLGGPTSARLIEPAAYAWLYRNDRAWLEEANASVSSRRVGPRPRVNWDERDQRLAREVQKTWLELRTEYPTKPLKLVDLYRRLGELKIRLASLDRLPLTKAALNARAHRGRSRDAGTRILI